MKKTPPTQRESEIKKKLARLIDVKSIITLTFTFVIATMALLQLQIPEIITEIYKDWLLVYVGAKGMSDAKNSANREKE